MAGTGWSWADVFLEHITGGYHPESPERLRAIAQGVRRGGLDARLTRLPVAAVDDEVLWLNHAPGYVERVRRGCAVGEPYIDVPDSAVSEKSELAARHAVGAVLSACDAVMARDVDNAFCPVRPPGHHAKFDRSAGFCLYNNVAIAARYLLGRHGLSRVAILDWDVHHGDGTQASFWREPRAFFCSLHEHPLYCYPGTGFATETGEGPGAGATLNIPMLPGTADDTYHTAFEEQVLPALRAFRPEFILVSNGLDAHARDPLAGLSLSDDAFTWMTQQTVAAARELCGGRLVLVLEGGYNLEVLERCVAAQVLVLLDA